VADGRAVLILAVVAKVPEVGKVTDVRAVTVNVVPKAPLIVRVLAALFATPVPPLAAGRMPVTPVVNGRPVALVSVPEDGVPRAPPLTTNAPAVPVLTPNAVKTPVPVVVVAGAAPAPPPIIIAFAAKRAEVAQAVALLKYGTPPEVPATVSANVPEPVIGEPATEINPPVNDWATLVTVPPPPEVAIQFVMPVPSVDRTYPLVPPVVGRVMVHVPAAAADLTVTAPEVEPDKSKLPAVVPATPSVNAPLLMLALAAQVGVPVPPEMKIWPAVPAAE